MAHQTLTTFHTLAIIGNGFDINLGFDSRYSDFIKSEEFGKLIYDKNELALYLKERIQIQNWIDVEVELENFAILHPKRPDYRDLFDNLFKALEQYLNRICLSTTFDQNSLAYNFMHEISEKGTQIVSFNFTRSIEVGMKMLKIDKNFLRRKIVNIHGTLIDRNIIFRVHDSAAIGDHRFLKKTHGIGYNAFNMTQTLHEAVNIVVFGHSLGKTDHQYFKKFFTEFIEADPRSMERKLLKLYHQGINGRRNIQDQIDILVDGQMLSLMERMDIEYIDTSK